MNIRKIIREEVNDFDWFEDVPSSDELPIVHINEFLDEYIRVIRGYQTYKGWEIEMGQEDDSTWSTEMLDRFYFEVTPRTNYVSIEMFYDNPFDPHSENIKELMIPKFNYVEQIEPWINDKFLKDVHITLMTWIDDNLMDINDMME